MNNKLRQFEKESKLEIFGLGARRVIWEAALEKYAELIVEECVHVAVFKDSGTISTAEVAGYMAAGRATAARLIKEHFANKVEESKGWVCPKCKADRTKIPCPLGFGAQVDGRCPMTVEAQ